MLPSIPLLSREEIQFFRKFIQVNGYSYSNFQAIGIDPFRKIPTLYPLLSIKSCTLGKLGILLRLFLLGEEVSLKMARKELGSHEINRLIQMGIIANVKENKAWSNFMIIVYKKFLFVTDLLYRFSSSLDSVAENIEGSLVYPINQDSIELWECLSKRRVTTALDLGTGCGFHAILISQFACNVYAVDINPRAVEMTRLNVALNAVKTIDVLSGDLFNPVRNKKFDLIVSNPPSLLPVRLHEKRVYQDGGKDGMEILKKIIIQIPSYLSAKGRCYLSVVFYKRSTSIGKIMQDWVKNKTNYLDIFFIKLVGMNSSNYSSTMCLNQLSKGWRNYVQCIEKYWLLLQKKKIAEAIYGIFCIKSSHAFHYDEIEVLKYIPVKASSQKLANAFFSGEKLRINKAF